MDINAHRHQRRVLVQTVNYIASDWLAENWPSHTEFHRTVLRNAILGLIYATEQDDIIEVLLSHPQFRRRTRRILERAKDDLPELVGRLITQYRFEKAEAA